MKRFLLFACVALLGLGTIAALRTGSPVSPSDVRPKVVDQATNGAYRDGLYLGRLAVGRGDPYHTSVGRWSKKADRAAFAVGYQQGYAMVDEGNSQAASSIVPVTK
jgi:hypothetical protein